MEFKDIKQIIDLMTKHELMEFELERDNMKIRIKRGADGAAHFQSIPVPAPVLAAPAPVVPAGGGSLEVGLPANVKEIKSPMVGTFYRSPSPESPAFVEIGQAVTEDTVVCIIEAMKVMNEIKAEVRGTITEILIDNAKPVEFGKPLFRVKTG